MYKKVDILILYHLNESFKEDVTVSFFTPDYDAPGAGVPENEEQKPGIIRYFVVAGRKFWDMVVLNIMYLLTSLIAVAAYSVIGWLFLGGAGASVGTAVASPDLTEYELKMLQEGMHLILSLGFGFIMTALLGSGAPRAGMSYVLRNYSDERHAFLWSDFKEYTLKYFFKGTLVFLIDLVFVFVICLDIYSYSQTATFSGLIATYIALFIFLMYIIMHPYIYMILVSFDLKLGKVYKNAFMLSAVRIIQNIGCLIAAVFLMVVMLEIVYKWNVFLFLLFMMFFAFPCLILDMNSFSVVKKYMIREK